MFPVPSPHAPAAPAPTAAEEQPLEAPVAEPPTSTEEAPPVLPPAAATPSSPTAQAEAPAEPAAPASDELPPRAPESTPVTKPDSPIAASPVAEEAVRVLAWCCLGEVHRRTSLFQRCTTRIWCLYIVYVTDIVYAIDSKEAAVCGGGDPFAALPCLPPPDRFGSFVVSWRLFQAPVEPPAQTPPVTAPAATPPVEGVPSPVEAPANAPVQAPQTGTGIHNMALARVADCRSFV